MCMCVCVYLCVCVSTVHTRVCVCRPVRTAEDDESGRERRRVAEVALEVPFLTNGWKWRWIRRRRNVTVMILDSGWYCFLLACFAGGNVIGGSDKEEDRNGLVDKKREPIESCLVIDE